MRSFENIAGRMTVLIGVLLATLTSTSWADRQGKGPVKVFVLVGQSNMQGKASLLTLDHQIKAERTKEQFAHLHDGQGNYLVRDDVLINFLDRHGKLEVGYGSKERFGPELGFGWTVGEAIDEPVLIIKAAYGGRSLFRDFRSPSAGLPDEARLKEELDNAKKRKPETTMDDVKSMYGFAYRDMLGDVKNVQENYETLFPELKGKELELAGFVWFQGWNDMINGEFSAAYTDNMVHFIQDVRKDLDAPNMPFIIGQLGVDGPYEGDDPTTDKKEVFKANQAAAADRPELKGNVAVVKTDQYWDPVAAEAYKVWKEDIDAWRHHGNDFAYHYLGSPKIIYEIGEAFGKQMLQMLEKSP
jgi:alpha-galactosidase